MDTIFHIAVLMCGGYIFQAAAPQSSINTQQGGMIYTQIIITDYAAIEQCSLGPKKMESNKENLINSNNAVAYSLRKGQLGRSIKEK